MFYQLPLFTIHVWQRRDADRTILDGRVVYYGLTVSLWEVLDVSPSQLRLYELPEVTRV